MLSKPNSTLWENQSIKMNDMDTLSNPHSLEIHVSLEMGLLE